MRVKSKLWSEEVTVTQEDQVLQDLVQRFGPKKWLLVAKELASISEVQKTSKQCRERWSHYLNPSLNRSEWLPSEEDTIFRLSKAYKNQWSKIARQMPGRSENSIKNYFYSTVRKNIRRINKRQVFNQTIAGPIKELLNNSQIAEFIFCNSRHSEFAIEKAIRRSTEENKNEWNSELLQVVQETNGNISQGSPTHQIENQIFLEEFNNYCLKYCNYLFAYPQFTYQLRIVIILE